MSDQKPEIATQISRLRSEPWLIKPSALAAFMDELKAASDLEVEAGRRLPEEKKDDGPGYTVRDGVASFAIHGPILKRVPGWARAWGIRATGADETREALARAMEDPSVHAVHLDVDSPGGTVAGVGDLADAIYAARSTKSVVTHTTNMMDSAAYWIGSQAQRVLASATAEIGSIGCFATMHDSTKAFEDWGVKVHVIRSGPIKGGGVPGAPITEEQLDVAQAYVDGVAEQFVGAIARGRGMPTESVRELATGAYWIAGEALQHGLIDRIATEAEAHAEARGGPTTTTILPLAADARSKEMADNKGADASAEKIAQLERELEAAKAKESASAAAIASMRAQQRKDMVEGAVTDGRVTPGMRAQVEAFADKCEPAELKAFLASLPVQTSKKPIGETPRTENANGIEALTAADLACAKRLARDPRSVAISADVAEINRVDGVTVAVMTDGRHVPIGKLYSGPAS